MTDDPIIYTPRKRRLSRVPPEEYQWRSRGRVAYGKITILDGDPGVGKSTITLDWAAAETRGWDYCDPAPQDQREEKWTKRGVVAKGQRLARLRAGRVDGAVGQG